jgi:hypothetical protein
LDWYRSTIDFRYECPISAGYYSVWLRVLIFGFRIQEFVWELEIEIWSFGGDIVRGGRVGAAVQKAEPGLSNMASKCNMKSPKPV